MEGKNLMASSLRISAIDIGGRKLRSTLAKVAGKRRRIAWGCGLLGGGGELEITVGRREQ